MMKFFFLVWVMVLSVANGGLNKCTYNTQDVAGTQQSLTITEIERKQNELKNAIKKYKGALKEKREMMMKLWKTTKQIEFIMKENQVIRRRIIKHWESVKNTH